jgi:hypothetical protein
LDGKVGWDVGRLEIAGGVTGISRLVVLLSSRVLPEVCYGAGLCADTAGAGLKRFWFVVTFVLRVGFLTDWNF